MRIPLIFLLCALSACDREADFTTPGGLTAQDVSGRHRLIFEPSKRKGFSITISSAPGGPLEKSMQLDVDIERKGQGLGGCTTRDPGKPTGPGDAVCTLENGSLNIVSGNPKGIHFQFVFKNGTSGIAGPAYMAGPAMPSGRLEIGTAQLRDMPLSVERP